MTMSVVDSLGSLTARYAAYQFAGIAGSFWSVRRGQVFR